MGVTKNGAQAGGGGEEIAGRSTRVPADATPPIRLDEPERPVGFRDRRGGDVDLAPRGQVRSEDHRPLRAGNASERRGRDRFLDAVWYRRTFGAPRLEDG